MTYIAVIIFTSTKACFSQVGVRKFAITFITLRPSLPDS